MCVCSFFSRWYDEHLKECEGGNDKEVQIRIVLLTNDRENREKAKKEGIISYTGSFNRLSLIVKNQMDQTIVTCIMLELMYSLVFN